jgi:hypothetical protein
MRGTTVKKETTYICSWTSLDINFGKQVVMAHKSWLSSYVQVLLQNIEQDQT